MITVTNLSKAYGTEQVLSNIGLTCPKGQTLSILGRSGSGKTTLLKVLAGLEAADGGQITMHGQEVNQWPAQKRQAIYLYQEALLFPHLNVFNNVAFGLHLHQRKQQLSKATIAQKVTDMLQVLGLAAHANKMPAQLSGGQRQRVAFGRALVLQPPLLLLDEPFGALDVDTRQHMQNLYGTLCQQQQITALFVTHDVKEAVSVGQQYAYMNKGQLTTYSNLQQFMADEATGFQRELAFWQQFANTQAHNKQQSS